ncbi:hypothetical protein Hanom_Chr13g01213791 [Helianthus anomalus]
MYQIYQRESRSASPKIKLAWINHRSGNTIYTRHIRSTSTPQMTEFIRFKTELTQ